MAPDIRLDRYVQRKTKRGREYFFFRIVRDGKERRWPLPHPFEDGYRKAYRKAWEECFGVNLAEIENPHGFEALIRKHKESAKYNGLSKDSKNLRNMACDLVLDRWGDFLPSAIRPIHAQALYDSLADRPATANRRLDDISALFSWGKPRGFADINPCEGVERVVSEGSYEPWPEWALEKLFKQGKPHILKPALGAIYTGQRRGDLLHRFTASRIRDGLWTPKQGKTGTPVPIPLHPVMLAMVEEHRELMKKRGIIDPDAPIFENSRGKPWGSGFGASWSKELTRLKLHVVEPRLTFHGLRTTNATLIASAVAKSPELYGGIERVRAMLGHLSKRMSEHYARRAEVEQMNTESVLLLPDFGNHLGEIGNR
ncbi:hypothetical protein SAMN04490244_101300 [Tranquillimonas rosea]|uniref:Phage integrase family protein n=1 Tax=Tranquillimonas rosea TaxID=641238 RepID=A0A1H9PSP5_9RHOB|nr:hypothetical protein [Tranquillimonas rosea]SER50779.1 hypothetical protein SAMN04490244_101300 [Tranquillimonas rosea]